jgi:hypothetical protein
MNNKRIFSAASVLFLIGCGNGESTSAGASAAQAGTAPSLGEPGGSATGGASTTSEGGGGRVAEEAGSGGKPAAAGSGSAGAPSTVGPTPVVHACDGLAAPGVFEEITPPAIKAGIGTTTSGNQTKAGTFAMAVDQVNQGTVYAGSAFQGLWKSTDCGATWVNVASGTHSAEVNSGMNWTLQIDPTDPQVVYTNSGYGSNGLFKSVDGGVNWSDIWSKASQPELSKAFTYNFANVIAIDPSNNQHILLTFHEECQAPHPATCIVESMDAGSTWRIIDGQPSWNGNEGQVIFFLQDSKTWLWGSQTNGFWRSGDSGQSWEAITGMTTSHLQSSQLLRTKDGGFFVAASDGIWRSSDGTVPTWKLIPDTGPIVGGLVSDGTTMYASTCYFPNFCTPRYLRSAESDGNTWTEIPSPQMSQGGNMGYDKAHHLLYSSNLDAGLWRVVVE